MENKNKVLWFADQPDWAYNLMYNNLVPHLKHRYDFKIRFLSDPVTVLAEEKYVDIIMANNLKMLDYIKYEDKAIRRIDSFRVFRNSEGVEDYSMFDSVLKDKFVVVTNNELGKIARKSTKNVFLIQNGLNLDIFKPKEVEKKSFTVGFVGNVSFVDGIEYKGYHFVLQAVRDLGVDLRVRSFRPAPYLSMPDFYRSLNCFVLPSQGEGCSNVIAEAIACGIPVIITKVGYHGEMLENAKNCIFVERNLDSVKEAIKYVVDHPKEAKEIGLKGREFAEKHHNIFNISKKYDELFSKFLEENK